MGIKFLCGQVRIFSCSSAPAKDWGKSSCLFVALAPLITKDISRIKLIQLLVTRASLLQDAVYTVRKPTRRVASS